MIKNHVGMGRGTERRLNRGMQIRSGVSRMELAIIVLVCLLLGQLLFPAIQYARDRSRLKQCESQLRHIGLALHAYHERFSTLPPAATWGSEGLDLAMLNSHRDPTPVHVTRQNWIQMILPDLDQRALADQFVPGVPVADAKNRKARTFHVPFLSCPSDTYNRPDNRYQMPMPDGSSVEFTRGNYAINGGSEYVPASFGTLANPGPSHSTYLYDNNNRTFSFLGNGIAGINSSLSLKDFRNGTSTLVAVEEVRSGLASIDTRGVWALGQIGASITWGHGVTGDDGAPNATEKHTSADDIRQGKRLYEQLGKDLVDGERMQVCDHCDENTQATARSKHDGGVNVLMLDGSVRFVSDRVEPTLWHVMHSRETPSDLLEGRLDIELLGPTWTEDEGVRSSQQLSEQVKEIQNVVRMKFVRIPKGKFVMGLADAGIRIPFPDDAIPHPVEISQDYFLGMHEVTQYQYEQVMRHNPSTHKSNAETIGSDSDEGITTLPVETVSWEEAVQFCMKLSEHPDEKSARRKYRLPTEAEWEYACRGGENEPIPIDRFWREGDVTGIIAGKLDPPRELRTVPVGSYPPNAFGLYDMCGNVFEWVADFRGYGYYGKSRNVDPQGPLTGYLHVIRGWHWVATGPRCRVYVANEPWEGSPHIGFRVVCEHF